MCVPPHSNPMWQPKGQTAGVHNTKARHPDSFCVKGLNLKHPEAALPPAGRATQWAGRFSGSDSNALKSNQDDGYKSLKFF